MVHPDVLVGVRCEERLPGFFTTAHVQEAAADVTLADILHGLLELAVQQPVPNGFVRMVPAGRA